MTRMGGFGVAGVGAIAQTSEREILWGGDAAKGQTLFAVNPACISGAARDSTNTPTTHLRKGLVLGKITASGKYAQYDPTATDGTQVAVAVLYYDLKATDYDANNADRNCTILLGGPVIASQLVGLDQNARAQLAPRFIFDDDIYGNKNAYPIVEAKTADYTVVSGDRGKIFTNEGAAGAVNFTLPTIAKGFYARFFVEANQNLTVTAATGDTMVVFNDAAADSIAFSTASEKIGSAIEVHANASGTKWLVFVFLGSETATPTIAT